MQRYNFRVNIVPQTAQNTADKFLCKSARSAGEKKEVICDDDLFFISIGVGYFFLGMFFRSATMKSQNLPTLSMLTRSSGECGCMMVGPKEIISQFG